ncbi:MULTISPECIES: YjiH family protein [Turicibacter]|jgi:transporter gate domain protein|uniref:YjiH family protein n=1 Tax=Turicibacter TaxID=191303 RepID=UPI0001FDB367|nr:MULTISPECIES: YjiH family protein [Turicibacter]EGC91670.1 transporter gate domain protein [Turicibacter sp. HGF1]MCU7197177.1 YjiH family protein [Turicibacter sanguinis]MDB8439013.1 YjiH family protein [Turicibacter sanguinis]MDB8556782.1 YjiH family protein [Turicibacter sanguinis]MDB8559478.1 YjiH family protein [Turicibacter sanguinis]
MKKNTGNLGSCSSKNLGGVLKFVIPSLLGVFLFMTPISIGGEITIPVAVLSKWVQSTFADVLPMVLLLLVMITAVGTLVTKIFSPKFIIKNDFLNTLFNVTPVWFVIRMLAAVFIVMALYEVGFAPIYSGDTGGLVLYDLLPILFSVFLFAGLFLPLLLNFGLLEFIGTLLSKIMRPVFNLPGRSAIDCIASWLGDGTIGVLLTSKQYEDGFYTKREAAVIGTTFSLVSITFSLVVIDTVGLSRMFLPFYFTVTVASLVAAIVLPKLPPLSKKPDIFFDGTPKEDDEVIPAGSSSFSHGLNQAIKKAKGQDLVKVVFVDGFKNVLDMWLAVIPIVMAVGTIALVVAEYTPLFKILGLPFYPVLWLLQVPEAMAASQTLVAGFADMLLPSILASGIESEMTRFVVAAVSVSQLIYLSEVGALLLASKIPVSLKELFIIFIQRTLITLPVIALIAHLIF